MKRPEKTPDPFVCAILDQTQGIMMAGELILIVEDNEKNLKLLRDVLQVKGYATLEAMTAEEGLDLACAKQPALILMDIKLPGMDGITALRQLRANPLIQGIPVIAVTASALPLDRQRILSAGFDGYQTKPIKVSEFIQEVTRVLAARSGMGGAA